MTRVLRSGHNTHVCTAYCRDGLHATMGYCRYLYTPEVYLREIRAAHFSTGRFPLKGIGACDIVDAIPAAEAPPKHGASYAWILLVRPVEAVAE